MLIIFYCARSTLESDHLALQLFPLTQRTWQQTCDTQPYSEQEASALAV